MSNFLVKLFPYLAITKLVLILVLLIYPTITGYTINGNPVITKLSLRD